MAYTNWYLIHLIGLTMGIDFKIEKFFGVVARLVGTVLLCFAAHQAVAACADTALKKSVWSVGLIDARRPDSVIWLPAFEGAFKPSGRMAFFRLSEPKAKRVECCLNVDATTEITTALRDVGNTKALQPAQGFRSRLTPGTRAGFIGLALPVGSQVRRLSPQKLVIKRSTPNEKYLTSLEVKHCLSAEGLHVWLEEVTRSTKHHLAPIHYYQPLDYGVQADCPAAWVSQQH
jgi:hypothetical protein